MTKDKDSYQVDDKTKNGNQEETMMFNVRRMECSLYEKKMVIKTYGHTQE